MSEALVCVKDFEKHAFAVLPRNALDYYRSGAGAEETLVHNRKAFSKFKIRPRCLRNVAKRDLSTTILGEKVEIPIGISPTAMQRMAHPEGECANARAAQAMGTIFTLSTIATSSIEEVAQAAPYGTKWFQLYIYNDRQAGFKALVLTIDTPMFGLRLADIRNKFVLPPHLRFANFSGDKATGINTTEKGSGLNNYVNRLFDQSLEWKDIRWLQSITKLPIILKGILTAEDALIGADLGVAGILVSNHGARQVDGTPASIEALPEIVKAVGDRVEIYLDGGVTDGTDVFKALALGAKMVFLGRPALWGLAHSGEEGVKKILTILKTELDYALAITGCASIKDIGSTMVVHEAYYSRL
ncbi:hydroxyacid oxidase 1 [Asbolus verrucosus]|uniref:(S)-2-hydroxy-acid oxidase n=1 Tax=Asbolus verrucosus TaxID=1661398 RepID=A0A482VCM9_ASBVE|nr:hydroxyacid oxidase 1 [Asbolus verrucosus]